MKVSLSRPGQKMPISTLVVQDKGKGQLSFTNASRCEIVGAPSHAYRQTFNVWQKEQGN